MNKHFLKNILFAIALFTAPSALAQSTWTNTDANGNWNDANNWIPSGIPNAAGATADLTLDGGGTVTINSSVTVGILNIGSTTTGAYSLNGNSSSLTLNNSGSGAQINEISTALGDSISAPIIVSDTGGLNITDSATSTSAEFQINGGITGTGNVTFTNNSGNTGNALVTGNSSQINNAGTLTIAGTGTGTVRFQGGVGSNVTQIIQNSATSQLYFAGAGITVASGGTTYTLNAGTTSADGGTGFTGTGNAVLDNNTNNNDALDIGGPNNTGTVTSDGTGTGHAEINGNVGNSVTSTSNVTELIVEAGAMSGLEIRGGNFYINTSGTSYLIDNSNNNTADIELKQGTLGTGNLVMEANGTASITLGENGMNNAGDIINQGTGTGGGNIDEGGPTLGANVQAVIENSTTSSMDLRFNNAGSFTGTFEVEQGTMQLSGGNGNFSVATKLIVGDTAAHGSSATLAGNIDGGTLTTGATETISGFGTITNDNVTTVSGSGIAPGSLGNIGKLTINSGLSLATGTNLTFALGTATGTPATSVSSALAVGNTLTLASGLNLDLIDNAGANSQGSLGAGEYELMSYGSLSGASAGDISSLFDIRGPAGFTYDVTDTGTGTGQIDLTVVVAAPEPGTWAMLLGGLGLLFGAQKLRGRKA